MVQKAEIRSWHRQEFNDGKLDNIPAHVVDLLKAEKKGATIVMNDIGKASIAETPAKDSKATGSSSTTKGAAK